MAKDLQLNVRVSPGTKGAIDELAPVYGNQSDVIRIAVHMLWVLNHHQETEAAARAATKHITSEQ